MNRACSILAALAASITTAVASADTLTIRPNDAPPGSSATVYNDVKVESIDAGQIVFTTQAGNQVTKDFSTVVDMQLDDEPDFNDAERDYLDNRFDRAVDEFDQTLAKTDKAWLKSFCAPRMTDAANKAGRFDKAVQGYILLVMTNPGAAVTYHPALPPDGSPYLDGAATALQTAADAPGVTQDQTSALLAMLLDVDRARNDSAGMAVVAARLGKTADLAGDPNAVLAAGALADAKLAEARSDIDAKNFDQAAAVVEATKNLLLDAARQSEGLFILAEARQGQAAAKNDPDAWRDAAIAYLRVVADFKDAKDAPHVADSLLAAGEILEKLNETAKAEDLYQSVVHDYPGAPSAEEARKALSRLGDARVN